MTSLPGRMHGEAANGSKTRKRAWDVLARRISDSTGRRPTRSPGFVGEIDPLGLRNPPGQHDGPFVRGSDAASLNALATTPDLAMVLDQALRLFERG